MRILGATDVGAKRQNNEDTYRFCTGDGFGWAVVCDGVGGANGGEVASGVVANSLEKAFRGSMRKGISSKTIMDIIDVGISGGYLSLLDRYHEDNSLAAMATTVAGAVMTPEETVVFWAGDSRVYLLRGDQLTPLTKDHSVVAQMVSEGVLSPTEAENHPKRNYITNCVGVQASPMIDYAFAVLQDGDWLLLCSDGVNDYIPSLDLPGIVAKAVLAEEPNCIIERAIQGGGGDNITAVLMQYERR